MMRMMRFELFGLLMILATTAGRATAAPAALEPLIQKHCAECHDAETQKGDLDLTGLKFDLADAKTFAKWVTVYDRVNSGEMPPKKKARPAAGELAGFEKSLSGSLTAADDQRAAHDGRATQRRANP